MEPYVIAISGASHSGKTTFINNIKSLLGDSVVVYDEVIRKYITNIDEIRKDTKAYFDLQLKIISEKMAHELFCRTADHNQNKIVILDRSLADSLYYYTKYVDANQLTGKDIEDYYCMAEIIIKKMNFSMKNIYDKVLYFHPIDPTYNTDPMRPNNILVKQNLEAFTIKSLLVNSMLQTNTLDKLCEVNILQEKNPIDVLFNCIDFTKFTSIWEEFLEAYLRHVEKNYLLSNVITNEYGSVDYINVMQPFLFPGLCTEDKEKSDVILDLCKSYHVDPEWEDSRCHPTGVFRQGNIMIVGEAPGRKGRALNSEYLKPSFIFTATSAILRFSLFSRFNECPYITNLLKYAKPGNDVKIDDFNDNFHILMKEIELIDPPMIIALGKNTARFLHQNLPEKYRDVLRSYIHPAALTYRSIDRNTINNYAGGLYKLVYGDDSDD